jgi:hypothetical protein
MYEGKNEMPSVEALDKLLNRKSLDEHLIQARKDMEFLYRSGHMDDLAYNKMSEDIQKLYAEVFMWNKKG